MPNEDCISPELYDQPVELWLARKQRVDIARRELKHLELFKDRVPHVEIAHIITGWRNALVIRLAELHLVNKAD